MMKTPTHPLRNSRLGWAFACAMLLFPLTTTAQVTMRPTNRPVVTAENERWYMEGQAITFSGGVYYPAGAPVYFNGNEMVMTGDYRGIPLYIIATRDFFDVCRRMHDLHRIAELPVVVADCLHAVRT